MGFMKALEKNEKGLTDNGAVGFVTEGHKLVDLNFAIPSFRNGIDEHLFDLALEEDKILTLKWLLYLRDVRGGVGERNSFRDFMVYLCDNHTYIAVKFIRGVDIAEYGRWDDVLDIYFRTENKEVKEIIKYKVVGQFIEDIENLKANKPVSLLAKWMYSENASSIITKNRAKELRKWFNLSSKEYRKVLSKLRKHIDVVECKMSANKWDKIDYSAVPSKANLNYGDAFMRHDSVRRENYLAELANGRTKINAQAMFLHDIVHKYRGACCKDATLEALWKAQDKVEGFSDTLVVRDGSGSMLTRVGDTGVYALEIATAITLYCAQNNSGQFKNKFSTFSSRPKLVTVTSSDLYTNLNEIRKYNDCLDTNIEATFDLILNTAIKNNMSQEDLPKTVLIASDMQFNEARGYYFYDEVLEEQDEALFETIRNKFERNGYEMPKLVFWNLCGHSSVIPLTENKNGVVLLSGFSKNLLNMVMSSKLNPYEALVEQLNVERYSVVDKIFES